MGTSYFIILLFLCFADIVLLTDWRFAATLNYSKSISTVSLTSSANFMFLSQILVNSLNILNFFTITIFVMVIYDQWALMFLLQKYYMQKAQMMVNIFSNKTFLSFFFFFLLFKAILLAYESSQAWGQIGAAAPAGLPHSHSNAGYEPRLWPTPYFTAAPDC